MLIISSFFVFFAKKFRLVNLIIEQGNTSSKVAIYQAGHVVDSFVYKKLTKELLEDILERYPLEKGIFSTVIETDEELICFMREKLQVFLQLDTSLKLPITIGYKTPQTLGQDRLAAVVGANV